MTDRSAFNAGSVTSFTYDGLDRVLDERVDGALRGRRWYDRAGNRGPVRLIRQYQTGGEGIVQELFFFDAYGRVDEQRIRVPDANTSGWHGFRNYFEYLDSGQVSSVRHPTNLNHAANYEVEYTHNTRTGAQTGLSETAASGGETIVSDVVWNQAGQVAQHHYGDAATDTRAQWNYHPATLRLTQDTFGRNNFISLHRSNIYKYDDNSNITSIREVRNSNQYQCFTYDGIDRLTSAYTDNTENCNGHTAVGQGNYNDTYTYDAGGNLITHTGTGSGTQRGSYTYNAAGLEHAVSSISDGSTFTYDANGNMELRNLAGQPAQQLEWDEGRRLASVSEGSTTVAEFLYSIDDTRVRRVTDDGTTTYYLMDGSEYTEGPNGNYFTYYHSINGRMVAFTNSDSGDTTWMGSDIVNSTAVTRDENGVVNTQRYTPFGELRNDDGLATDHRYTGQVLDESTGLAFYNARYYDPAIGRFVTPDSIVPNPNNGQDYNRYTYVRNNPIRYSDPSGNCPVQPAYAGCTDASHAEQCVSRPNSSACRGYQAPTAHQASANEVTSGFIYDAVGVPVEDARDTIQGLIAIIDDPGAAWQAVQQCVGASVECGRGAVDEATEECQTGTRGECAGRVVTLVAGGTTIKLIIKRVGSRNAPGSLAPNGTGGIGPVRVGQAGEAAVRGVYDIGPKATVSINGRTRILDGLTDRAVTEVKNVQSLSLTQQIRDNIDYAAQTGRRLDIYVRPSSHPSGQTHLSGPLLDAIEQSSGAIQLRFIPQ